MSHSAQSKLALGVFSRLDRLEHRKEELDEELNSWVTRIHEEDLEFYVKETDKIIRRHQLSCKVCGPEAQRLFAEYCVAEG